MSYRYRAYPDPAQSNGLSLHASHARFVWNLAVEQNYYFRVAGRVSSPPNSAARFRQLAEARADSEWLAAGSSSVQQQAVRDYDRSVRNWLGYRSHRKPSWRKAGRDEGFCIRDVRAQKVNRRWGRVFVPKVGWLRFRLTRPLPTKSGMARVTFDSARRWHVSFTAAQPAIERKTTGSEVGIDRGVATTLACSTGQHYQVPHSPNADRKARKLAIAMVHARSADRRKNWIEKTTTTLIRDHDVIVLEDLRIKNMVRRPKPKPDADLPGVFLRNHAHAKAGLNRSIHRSCWGLFAQRLQDKATGCGITLLKVNPAYSSQQFQACSHAASENRESQAIFRCVKCGHENRADTNAAENVLARGLRLAPTPGHEGQDPEPARSARVNPERSAARTTRTKAAA